MHLESKTGTIYRPVEDVFDYLNDLNNYKDLLPADKITDWNSDKDYCSFKIKGAAKIGFKKKDSVPYSLIYLVSSDDSPIEFDLKLLLEGEDVKSEGRLEFDADVNPFIRMMIEKPLNNLFDHMARKLEEKFI